MTRRDELWQLFPASQNAYCLNPIKGGIRMPGPRLEKSLKQPIRRMGNNRIGVAGTCWGRGRTKAKENQDASPSGDCGDPFYIRSCTICHYSSGTACVVDAAVHSESGHISLPAPFWATEMGTRMYSSTVYTLVLVVQVRVSCRIYSN